MCAVTQERRRAARAVCARPHTPTRAPRKVMPAGLPGRYTGSLSTPLALLLVLVLLL
jgi:hypothetical protein